MITIFYFIYRYLDLINVMTYDLRGSWEGFTGEDSPLYQSPSDPEGYIDFNVVCSFYCSLYLVYLFTKNLYNKLPYSLLLWYFRIMLSITGKITELHQKSSWSDFQPMDEPLHSLTPLTMDLVLLLLVEALLLPIHRKLDLWHILR